MLAGGREKIIPNLADIMTQERARRNKQKGKDQANLPYVERKRQRILLCIQKINEPTGNYPIKSYQRGVEISA